MPDRADVKAAWQRWRGVRAVVGSIDGIDRAPVLRELATALVRPDGVAIRYDSPWAEFLTGDCKP